MRLLLLNFSFMKLDMHFHSQFSDWTSDVETLLKLAQKKELDFVALTDHDRVSDEFSLLAWEYGISTTQSVEISAVNTHMNKSLHLTFYAHSIEWKIREILGNVLEKKKELIQKQILWFQNIWCEITYQDVVNYVQKFSRSETGINKYDIVRVLFQSEKNYEIIRQLNNQEDIWVEDFYLKFLKKWGEKFEEFAAKVDEYEVQMHDCKNAVEQNNGILSVAHPNFTFRNGIWEFFDHLPVLIKTWWVNAIEINAKATKEWVDAILQAKEKYNLFLTFWSDCHHIWRPDSKHGDFWDVNPFLTEEFISQEFEKYREKFGI